VGAFPVAGVAGSPGVGIIDGLRLIGEGPVPGAAAALDTPLLRLYAQLALGPPQRLFSEARGTRFLLDLQKAARAVPQHLLEKGPGPAEHGAVLPRPEHDEVVCGQVHGSGP